ncbi:NAD-dependent epimerase/dehydratase family protein [Tardiphaga sp. 619_E2_N8_4]|uniref:NAD-dependent epimerase/dehydratase family protein n=2 Tax=Tardiphaga TaxID=1395974 RepID=UPI003F24EE1A
MTSARRRNGLVRMKSLVIGATGIVGSHIVQHLVAAGERPTALSRTRHHNAQIDWIEGDLGAPDALPIAACETLYCTADVGLLAEALRHLDCSALKRVVVFTSTSIVTKMDSEIAAEREHLRRLVDGEQRLIAVCEQHSIGWTILRPTIIYAEGRDGNVSRLARLIQKFGFLPLMGSGVGLRQPVHAEDLAVGAIQAAASAAAVNKTYALPGGETITYREMVGRIFDALGKRRRIISAPPIVWRAAFALAKPFFPNANAAMGSRMSMDMVFDGAPAAGDFGWSPRGFRPKFSTSG